MNFKDRLLVETQELAEKLNKLNYFMSSVAFLGLSRIEKDLLYEQCRLMNSYVQVLGKRLEVYGVNFKHEGEKDDTKEHNIDIPFAELPIDYEEGEVDIKDLKGMIKPPQVDKTMCNKCGSLNLSLHPILRGILICNECGSEIKEKEE